MKIRLHCNLCGFIPGRTGGAQVFLEGLLPIIHSFEEIDLLVHGPQVVKAWLRELGDSISFATVGDSSHSIINRFLSVRQLKSKLSPGDLVWSPLNQGVGQSNGFKEIVTIHDLIPLHYWQASNIYPKEPEATI